MTLVNSSSGQSWHRNPKRHTMKANAKYGWLGRHTVHSRVSVRTINYELRILFTFFRWAIKKNFCL
jgi:hypothetical protein